MMQLCLGTVQFGMDYGIKGQKRPTESEALECLDYATQNGISAIDTAVAYGNAEEIVGRFLNRHTINRDRLFISTKLKPNVLDGIEPEKYCDAIQKDLKESLSRLHLNYVDAYLSHSARYAYRPEVLDALAAVKKEGLAKNVGVSVYEPEEAEAVFQHKEMSFIQLPYSIFDHRMKEKGIFEKKNHRNCTIASRSAFIQGLITMNDTEVPSFLEEAKPILKKIDKITKETGKSRIELAIGYVKKEQAVSYLVFGVDHILQLKEDIAVFSEELSDDIYWSLEQEFKGIKAEIVMPSLWKKEE